MNILIELIVYIFRQYGSNIKSDIKLHLKFLTLFIKSL